MVSTRILTASVLLMIGAIATQSFRSVQAEDHEWSKSQWQIIQSLSIQNMAPPPASPSNRYADNPRAADLGRALFFDEALAAGQGRSCATCHLPDKYFTDGLARSGGPNQSVGRNTPTVVGSAHQNWFYWDGRRDSLWSQALIPFEAPNEMGGNRVGVLKQISQDTKLARLYREVFGQQPYLPKLRAALRDGAGPWSAEPARSNWHRLSARDKAKVNRSYANVGKAIAAYIRTLQPKPSRFDQYVATLRADGELSASKLITPSERAGLELFITDSKTQCLRCHSGPRFTNENFQNIGTGSFDGENLDFGRVLGIRSVLRDEFNCLGRYSDAKPDQCHSLRFMSRDPHQPTMGAFKTPSLRNVSATAPYFHDGRFQTLEQVVAHYVSPPQSGRNSAHELNPIELNQREIQNLTRFLGMLSEQSAPVVKPSAKSVQKVTRLRR